MIKLVDIINEIQIANNFKKIPWQIFKVQVSVLSNNETIKNDPEINSLNDLGSALIEGGELTEDGAYNLMINSIVEIPNINELQVKKKLKNKYVEWDKEDQCYILDSEAITQYLYTKYDKEAVDNFIADDESSQGYGENVSYYEDPEKTESSDVEAWVDDCIEHWGGDDIYKNDEEIDEIQVTNPLNTNSKHLKLKMKAKVKEFRAATTAEEKAKLIDELKNMTARLKYLEWRDDFGGTEFEYSKHLEDLDEIQIQNTGKNKLADKIVSVLMSQRFDTWYKEDFDDLDTKEKINEVIKMFNL